MTLHPGSIRSGDYTFSVGTAGSIGLVFQTVLPILLQASGASRVVFKGGSHNPSAPPFDFLEAAYVPALRAMGHEVRLTLHNHGFYPAGGGHMEAHIMPAENLAAFVRLDRGGPANARLEALVSNLPRNIAEREIAAAVAGLSGVDLQTEILECPSAGPGNVIFARLAFEHVEAVLCQFGERNVSAEQVGRRLAKQVRAFLDRDVAITHHLADQLLLPMALGRGGQFSTLRPSLHSTTNADVIGRFLGQAPQFRDEGDRHICKVVPRP